LDRDARHTAAQIRSLAAAFATLEITLLLGFLSLLHGSSSIFARTMLWVV
jgi:hypothetical protein